jgi:hypothetical protein
MKQHRSCWWAHLVLLAVAVQVSVIEEALSIPIFARKYNQSCFTCHSAFPTLNEFGYRFKANGYQMPGVVEDTPIWDSNQLPVAIMTHAMFMRSTTKNRMQVETEDDIMPGEEMIMSGFMKPGVDIFSAGTLGKHLSYFFALPVETDGLAKVEMAYLIFNNLLNSPTSWLNIKVGLMRLDLPFAPNLALAGSDHQILTVSPVKDGVALAEPQLGASVMGMFTQVLDGLRYEIGIFNGTNTEDDNNMAKDFFARVNQTIYVNNAPFRFGALLYTGKQALKGGMGAADAALSRTAFDFELYDPWTKRVNLFGQYMIGKNDDTDGTEMGNQPFEFTGGFLGVNVLVIPERLTLFTKYDFLNVSKQWDLDPTVAQQYGNEKSLSSVAVGARFFFMPNVALQAEYIRQTNAIGYPGPTNGAARVIAVDSNSLAVGLDFVF